MSEQKQKSVAGGVFWGLFLFFIVLPIGSCAACGMLAAGAGTQTHRK